MVAESVPAAGYYRSKYIIKGQQIQRPLPVMENRRRGQGALLSDALQHIGKKALRCLRQFVLNPGTEFRAICTAHRHILKDHLSIREPLPRKNAVVSEFAH